MNRDVWSRMWCAVVAGFALLSSCDTALAQCEPTWQAGEGVPGIVAKAGDPQNSVWVCASAVWDPDGPGPAKELLVVGGDLQAAGDRVVKNVAAWDGRKWEALGEIETPVRTLVVHQGELYAGTLHAGSEGAEASNIWKWQRGAWVPVGGNGQDGTVFRLHSHNGELIAGGAFLKIDGVLANGIARWDGLQWHAIGKGLVKAPPYEYVIGLTTYGDQLVAAGSFDPGNIARWTGSTWETMGSGFDEGVLVVTAIDGEMYAGGAFAYSGSTKCSKLAHWNGSSWQKVGTAFTATYVRTIVQFGRKLYVGGDGLGQGSYLVASLEGDKWTSPGQGLAGAGCRTLCEYQGRLFAGGWIHRAGYERVFNIAAYDTENNEWARLLDVTIVISPDVSPAPPIAFGEGVAFAGAFYDGVSLYPSKRVLYSPTAMVGDAISLGEEFNSPVDELVTHQGVLVACGYFSKVGSFLVSGVAAWDGSGWGALGGGLKTAALPSIHSAGESLLAAGFVRLTESDPGSESVAVFDGDGWTRLGESFSQRPQLVRVHKDQPVIALPVPVPNETWHEVRQFNGSTWIPIGSPMRGNIRSILSHKGSLYIASERTWGASLPTFGVARWSGTQWLPTGSPTVAAASDLHVVRARLVAIDTTVASQPSIRELVGAQWQTVTPGASVAPISMFRGPRFASWKSEIVLVGSVGAVDGRYSTPWVRLACTCPADCDNSGALDIVDFICFQTLFALGEPAADCDASGSLDIDDYVCFQTQYAAGC